jgi:hypothetical protein
MKTKVIYVKDDAALAKAKAKAPEQQVHKDVQKTTAKPVEEGKPPVNSFLQLNDGTMPTKIIWY